MIDLSQLQPTHSVNVREVFGIDTNMSVPAFAERTEHVPAIDTAYRLNPQVTLAILAGFAHNRRVVIQGLHGTGKSTHIEQVAARLNWPCVTVSAHSRMEMPELTGYKIDIKSETQAIECGDLPENYMEQMGMVGEEGYTVGEEEEEYDDVPADAADEDGADEIEFVETDEE